MLAIAWALVPAWDGGILGLQADLLGLLGDSSGLLRDLLVGVLVDLLVELGVEVLPGLLEVLLGLLDVLADDQISGLGFLDQLPRRQLWLSDLDLMALVNLDQLLDALDNILVLGLSGAPFDLDEPVFQLILKVLERDRLASSIKEQELLGSSLKVVLGMVVGIVSFWD